MKKLYRSDENKIIAGVIGGLGEYFDIDPTLLRLAWLLIVLATGIIPGVIVYIIAIFVIPRRPEILREEALHTSDASESQTGHED